MKYNTSINLVPVALAATGLALLFLAGCRKEEPTPDPASPATYMNDQAFRDELKERRVERNGLLKMRAAIVEQMKAKVDAVKAALKTDDEKLVKAELEKDPEWQSLHRRCVDLNTAIDEQRQKTLGVVRERIAPAKSRSGQETASTLKRTGTVGTSGQETASTVKISK